MPTRIQEVLLPLVLEEQASKVWATTNPGSGVTLVYGVAALNRIDVTKNFRQAIILVHSYEAAIQVGMFMRRLSIYKNARIGLAVSIGDCKLTFCQINICFWSIFFSISIFQLVLFERTTT